MKSPAKGAAWLLPLLLAGCFHIPFHKSQPAQPMLAPPVLPIHPIELAIAELPPSDSLIPGRPLYNIRVHDETIKPPVWHRRALNPPEIVSTPEVAGNQNTAVSAIGVLSSGDPVSYQRQTEEAIASIERGINSINHPLSDSDQKAMDQIREFLKQARAALASGDVDGAHTLADKAQVLLAALTQ
jgi:hypothetical protein